MNYRRRLFSIKNPYDTQSDAVFVKAVQENFLYQYEHCKEYRVIADHYGLHASMLQSTEDLALLPCIPTLLLKRHHLTTASTCIRATSSGTSRNFSEINFDIKGLFCALVMSCKIMQWRELISAVPCHYIIMGYKPHRSNRTAVTKTAYGTTLFTPAVSRKFILLLLR